ncbi:tRNA modification GTPase GTPBP3, mitochondrial isoform X1 [Schistocerca gregaria]|uniref:tRNA modification GTPase GTPBP3, mitochondrial isoform X1 n=2 Tax=Schistocerca gregaria TaxID=7010 RepID=UPI00211E83C6|nr:tRNA modification GTPase GTPBP3, mitochondrial isoform X1 [Schistocerca gregaria]XP_049837090.1 tRNA modification GTPase GTPBP3, mitochondrial isoform X1 [Schistocerca gregaria]
MIVIKRLKLYTSTGYFSAKTSKRFLCDDNIKASIEKSTIYALSSGHGKCGVAVVRVSGPKAKEVFHKMAGLSDPKPRLATLRKIWDPVTKEMLDRGLVIWFPGPRSFTGEDSCELQVHGGPAVVAAIFNALSKIPGFRPAEAGEFTKRAFHAGKLDLTEVEGLADLIHAETEAQRRQAIRQAEGALAKLYGEWRKNLLHNLAHVEAHIDFDESEDIGGDVFHAAELSLHQLRDSIQEHLSDNRRGEILRSGVHTAIVGAPNAGKSSLLNIICRRQAAIVSPVAGTTRDVLELTIDIGGYPMILADTAGLRQEVADEIEKEGVSRAQNKAASADFLLLVVDTPSIMNNSKIQDIRSTICHHFASLGLAADVCDSKNMVSPNCIVTLNKIDVLSDLESLRAVEQQYSNVVLMSCKTEEGVPELLSKLTHKLSSMCGSTITNANPALTQARHRHHLVACVDCLDRFFQCTGDTVLAAHQLRKALRHIGHITGHVSSEQILDVIFRDFCIGK